MKISLFFNEVFLAVIVMCMFSRSFAQTTAAPTEIPTENPVTIAPSRMPSVVPTVEPSVQPSIAPTTISPTTTKPTTAPSVIPSIGPSIAPTVVPTLNPSPQPTSQPSSRPSRQPTSQPSRHPSTQPTSQPSRQPSSRPSHMPTNQPSSRPTSMPSAQPCSACGSGYFFDVNVDSFGVAIGCTQCKPGYYCQGGCHSPAPCALGYYEPSYGKNNCTVCPSGFYSLTLGQSYCSECPAGYQCPSTSSSPTVCTAGTYSIAGQSSCSSCPGGTYTSVQGSHNCTSCPAGYECPTQSSSPSVCQAGTYATANSATCLQCPPGHYCPTSVSALIYPCVNGTYALAGKTGCTACSAGSYCPMTTLNLEIPCSVGTYAVAGSSSCSDCPAGKSCTTDGASIVDCPDGYYSVLGQGTCTPCPAGYRCPYKAQAIEIACLTGTYSVAGQGNCTSCPVGSECPYTNRNTVNRCAAGTFSVGEQAACTECTAGYECTSTVSSVMTPCLDGYYAVAGSANCTACPRGYYCPNRGSYPVICPAGSYSTGLAVSCTLARAGYVVATSGAYQDTICGVGYYSNGGQSTCTPCSPGYPCPSGSTEPSPPGAICPMGGYCNPAYTYTPCPVGTYGIVTNGVSESQACTACDAGYYCPSNSTIRETRAVCLAGGYCPEGSSSVTYCAPGYQSALTGQTSIATCDACSRGTYCQYYGTQVGDPCPTGYYCPEGTANPISCPAGTYGTAGGYYSASQCSNCTTGHYCPGAYDIFPCPAGTYNPYSGGSSSASCIPCEAGYACPTSGMVVMTTACSAGHYCPPQTINPSDHGCPAGKYSDSTSLVSAAGCSQCKAGYTCSANTTSATMVECRQGYYCPLGTAHGQDIPCPNGTYSNLAMLTSPAECMTCLPGSYCSGGNTTVSGHCAAGHYCPAGTHYSTQYACPAGTYSSATNLYDVSQCLDCPAGHYCTAGSTTYTACASGRYAANNNTVSSSACSICEAGYKCPSGSTKQTQCGVGYYSAVESSSCTICPVGTYCGSNTTSNSSIVYDGGSQSSGDPSGVCFAGAYCTSGMTRAPDLLRDACPAGYYCPLGTAAPIPCPPGRYRGTTGGASLADCHLTPAGYYSLQNATEPTGICQKGYYCPQASVGPTEIACPNRTYNPYAGGESIEDCALCVAGGYCTEASFQPEVCPPGHYCVTGVSAPIECPPGTYANTSGLESVDQCTPCDGGHYCDKPGLTSPSGLCAKGYYCQSGSNTSTPYHAIDSVLTNLSYVGAVCPTGHYCEVGTTLPVACPAGTFNTKLKSFSSTDCVSCTPGFYCEGIGNTYPTGKCQEGYYCLGGAINAFQHETEQGYYSIAGSSNHTACPPGTYNSERQKHNCSLCQPGHYCPDSAMTTTGDQCTAGNYCPEGTAYPYHCPAGTFSSRLGLYARSECTPCTPGYYCEHDGLQNVTGPCDAGFYCTQNASTANPSDITGGECTKGHYCLLGSDAPTPCPRGTYMSGFSNDGNHYFNGENYYCELCPNGKACDGIGLLNWTSIITGGYWSVIGAKTSTPICTNGTCLNMYGICPRGSKCPAGATLPTACDAGYYQDTLGQATCKTCTAGHYCLHNTSYPVPCPAGSYCPAGTRFATEFLCPNGTYSNSTMLENVYNCTTCTAGHYCATEGLIKPTAKCMEGYFCGGGSSVSTPHESGASGYQISYVGETCVSLVNTTINDICPPGHYCPEGSEAPIQCPPGTNSSSSGFVHVSDCPPCAKGFYCPLNGTVFATRKCPAGHYCPAGTASITNTTASYCPAGSMCPEGSYEPTECGAGTYQDEVAQDYCKTCPSGMYCLQNTVNPVVCPAGSFCPRGTRFATEHLCPNGTYSNSTSLTDVANCTTCTAGYYCATPGLKEPTAKCMPGYFCGGGSSVSSPYESGEHSYQISYVGDTCVSLSNTTVNDICPPGHYCPEGSEAPIQCPRGTNSSSMGLYDVTQCPDCVKGYYCPNNGTVYATKKCLEGYFCPPGVSTLGSDTSLECPTGSMCPVGSYVPTACDAGTYQDERNMGSCKTCPSGSYCLRNTTTPVVCPAGSYCPRGSRFATEHLCPNGTYSNSTSLTDVANCTTCTAGYYCATPGLTKPTAKCMEGYFCGGGSSVSSPHESGASGYQISYVGETCVSLVNNTINDICPPGHYCPEGSEAPIQCPPGTNSSSQGLTDVSQCPPCQRGFYCPLNGTVYATRQCLNGSYCPSGTAHLTDNLLCPTGAYCTTGSYQPHLCPAGTYQDRIGQDHCKTCPAGHYCLRNTTTPEVCPTGSYCPTSTKYGKEFLCPNGTYSNSTGLEVASNCTTCTAGYYCATPGLTKPTAKCMEGYFCGGGSSVSSPHESGASGYQISYVGETCVTLSNTTINDICPPGHYCPEGSEAPIQCPPGTNSSSMGLYDVSQCPPCTRGLYCPLNATVLATRVCLAGSYCPSGTAHLTDNLLCPTGAYCPTGSFTPTICDEGTYQDQVGQDYCKTCPSGSYCLRNTTTPVVCPAGSYCPRGSRFATEHLCPNGTYSNSTSLTDVANCTTCTAGYYCATPGLMKPTAKCMEGYFCGGGSSVSTPHESGASGYQISYVGETCVTLSNTTINDICPPGHYCPEGSEAPIQCPAGTNSSAYGLYNVSQCPDCVKGYYCPNTATVLATRKCLDGYFCPPGVANLGNTTELKCPTGSKCPSGSYVPTACDPGYYQDEIGMNYCKTCPSGSYCLQNTTTPVICPPGSYCPSGTQFATQYLCPNGTYSNRTSLENVEECTTCTPGYYCATPGQTTVTDQCDAGYFCGGGSSVAAPFENGNTSVYQTSYTGETCASFVNITVNDVCPAGHYCPKGSHAPLPCPVGTNSTSKNLASIDECPPCSRGYYCPDKGTVKANLRCLPGYYCPAGTALPTNDSSLLCPTGHKCPLGSFEPTPCPAGYHQSNIGIQSCDICPSGYYCEQGTITPVDCPPGSYCPAGTQFATEYLCPNGTYSNSSNLESVYNCTTCTAGYYCATPGLTKPTAKCMEGYFCGGGSSVSTPHESGASGYQISYVGETCVTLSNTTINDICPPGHYCPTGSEAPVQCPPGTNSSSQGLTDITECRDCQKGFYCPLNGTVLATRKCLAGYFCPPGVKTLGSDEYLQCPTGSMCPFGSAVPEACPHGYYQDQKNQDHCKVCPAGYYCLQNTTTPVDCPPGSYCPAGTQFATQHLCPNGTYSNSTNLESVYNCTTCTAGYYCATPGLTKPTAKCMEGYFCGGGSSVSTPHESGASGYQISYVGETCVTLSNTTINDICPPGHYCPTGSEAPVQCPPGTNSSSTGLYDVSQCPPCARGHYCPLNGTVYATRKCLAGYFCPPGVANPTNRTSLLCPNATMCPVGSSEPTICPGGYYQNEIGRATCKTCPAGYLCDIGTITPHIICPLGQFCTSGNYLGEYCTNGTYGKSTGLRSQDECTDCDPGMYCTHGAIQGQCATGYFCKTKQWSPAPFVNISSWNGNNSDPSSLLLYLEAQDGGPCYPGHWCGNGTVNPTACANATVRALPYGADRTDCGPCQAGYTCEIGNPVPTPCLKGKYCLKGQDPIDCPVGTYNPKTARTSLDDCQQCPAGYFCSQEGTSNYASWSCPSGHFCLKGTTDPTPCAGGTYRDDTDGVNQDSCTKCPSGHYCPLGSSNYIICPAGYYCPAGSSNITACPAGYYCPTNTTTPLDCPSSYYCGARTINPVPCYFGTYCPQNSISPIPCPAGYKATNFTSTLSSVLSALDSACMKCPSGTYGADPARLVCSEGTPGYYFHQGTTVANPTNLTTEHGDICPSGHYCPAGSTDPVACPVGRYLPYEGASNSSECLACDANTYQYLTGQPSCFKCSSSSSSVPGSEYCSCVGQNRAFQATDGWCICKPGYEFVDSNLVVSSTNDGSYDCQPIVYSRCSGNQVRTFDGKCAGSSYCDDFCGADGGSISDTTGTCICNTIPLLDSVCNSTCREQATTVTCDGDTGNLVVYDPVTGSTTYVDPASLNSYGSITCSKATAGASIYSMSVTDGHFAGYFGTGAALSGAQSSTSQTILRTRARLLFDEFDASINSTERLATMYSRMNVTSLQDLYPFEEYPAKASVSRRLASSNSTASLSNPVVSISVGDSIIFDVSNGFYPVYVKDSLLNTNPDFDYSAFRTLETTAASNVALTTFSFTFDTAGDYVFQLSSSSSVITIISVLPANVAQSTAATFVEFNDGNLITLGIKSNSSIVLAPDWNLVIGLLLGMLAVVLVVVGFLYYFRKKAWSHHTRIDASYRKKNKKFSTDNKKGGIFGFGGNKVFADETIAKDAKKEDLESAAFVNDEELEFDDDMLIPDLAKHMQSHHDEIDRQLVNQNDLLNALQASLKKEVDELKALLASTAMDLAAGSDNKNKRISAILIQLKSDTLARGMYESDVDTMDKRIMNLVDQLRKALDNGVAKVANNIVHEVAQQAIDLSDRDEAIANLSSNILHAITSDLNEIKEYVINSLVQSSSNEKRRRTTAEESFDSALRNTHNVAFPQDVLDRLKVSREADLTNDITFDELLTVLRQFSEHIPKFVDAMIEGESSLARGLARTVEKGSLSLVEREQEIANQTLKSYLEDLNSALNALYGTVSDRIAQSTDSRLHGDVARTDLIAAIDAALALFHTSSDGDVARILEPLMAALKEGRFIDPNAGFNNRFDEQRELVENINVVDQKVIDDVLNNENLTDFQKEGILDSAEADLKMMENILELETKRKEEAIKQALELNAVTAAEEENINDKFINEQQKLKEELQEARNRELNDMMKGEESASVQDRRVSTLAQTRLTAFLRLWSSRARIAYKELMTSSQLKRLKIQLAQYDPAENLTAELCESRLYNLDIEETKSLDALSNKLASELSAGEKENAKVRDQWMADSSVINTDEVLSALTAEYRTKFVQLKSELKEIAVALRNNNKVHSELKMAVVRARYRDDQSNVAIQAVMDDNKISNNLVETLIEEDVRILNAEESLLRDILDHGTTWSAKIDERSMQSQLHIRILGGLNVNTSIHNRLALVEFELRSEVDKVRTSIDLTNRKADKTETERVLNEFNKHRLDDVTKLNAALVQKLNKTNDAEKKRQEAAPLNFEKERAFAIEQNAMREVKVSLQMYRSIRSIKSDIQQSLDDKKAALIERLRDTHESHNAETREVAAKQIEAEAMREHLELNVVYDNFEAGYILCERYLCEMVQGITPSIPYVQQLIKYTGSTELHLLLESARMDDIRKRIKVQANSLALRNFEESRLKELGRPSEDLKKMFEDVKSHTANSLKLIDVATAAELWRIESMLNAQLEETQRIHESYSFEVNRMTQEYMDEQSSLRFNFSKESQYISSNMTQEEGETLAQHQDKEANALTELEQLHCVHLAANRVQYTDNLYEAFKTTMTKIVAQEKIEDELRTLHQILQQETEILENVMDMAQEAKLDALVQSQKQRRIDEAALKNSLQKELEGQVAVLEAKKQSDLKFAEDALKLARDAREQELIKAGLSPEDAKAQAQKEYDLKLKAVRKEIEDEFNNAVGELRRKLDADMQSQLQAAKAQNDKLVSAVTTGAPLSSADRAEVTNLLNNNKADELARIEDNYKRATDELTNQLSADKRSAVNNLNERLDRKKADRIAQLVAGGMPQSEAAAKAREEIAAEKQEELAKIDKDYAAKIGVLDEQYKNNVADIHNRHDKCLDILNNGLEAHRNAEHQKLLKKLEEQRANRVHALIEQGMNAADAQKIADEEHDAAVDKETAKLRADIQEAHNAIIDSVKDEFTKHARDIEFAHEMGLKGYSAALDASHQATTKHLKDRLAKQKADKIRKLVESGMSVADATALVNNDDKNALLSLEERLKKEKAAALSAKQSAYDKAKKEFEARAVDLAAKEDEESVQLRADMLEKLQQFVNNGDQMTNAILNAAHSASKSVKDSTEEEIKEIRDKYSVEVTKLKNELDVKAQSEKANLSKRLQAKRARREAELIKQGKSSAEAKNEAEAEDAKQLEELEDKLKAEGAVLIDKKLAEGLEAEKRLIDSQHRLAESAANSATALKDAAQRRMEEIRKQHDQESKALEDRMADSRVTQERNLKARLAEKRQQKLQGIADASARQIEENRIAQEEHDKLLEMQKAHLAEEERQREAQKAKQELAEAAALEELKKAQIAAAQAAAKEAAIRAYKDVQGQAEEEIKLKEVQKRRDTHLALNEKRRQEEEHLKVQGKGKLDERLAAKRAKKEKELKEAEERALAELAQRQAAEAEQREKDRLAKMVWSDRVEDVIIKSRNLGLSVFETEDYCFKETLGKHIVPDNQINEAINLIQKERHDNEMTKLLTSHFQERIAALKAAVEQVVEEKSTAKVKLMEQLTKEGASEEKIQAESNKIEAEYNAKQMAAEKAATAALEPVHMQNQLQLRQKQLQDMARVVALYTDSESLSRLQSATGKTQEEEMQEYKAKIEAEKNAREEALRKEREEAEVALRQKLNEDMQRVQNQLLEEQKKNEAEIERKRLEMEKQKAEFQRKQEEEAGSLDKQEKEQKLKIFEQADIAARAAKEAEQKKAKERLMRRRSNFAGASTPSQPPSSALMNASATVQMIPNLSMLTSESRKSLARNASNTSLDSNAPAPLPQQFTQSMQQIETKLERIERVISALEKNGFQAVAAPPSHHISTIKEEDGEELSPRGERHAAASGAPYIPAYSDRDEPTPGESLEIVPEDNIQIQERARIDFGKKIAAMIGLKTLHIKSAYSLPPSKASNNAFCNSYYYSPKDNTLLVHNNRLSSSGDFGLVVIHALSHIKVNPDDLSNDADPKFLSEFYKNLKILSQDLYKKSAAVNHSAPPLLSKPAGPTPAPLTGGENPKLGKMNKRTRSSFNSSFSKENPDIAAALLSINTNLLDDALGAEAPITPKEQQAQTSADYFTSESLMDRMKQYAAQGGIPMEYMDRYTASYNKVTPPAAAAAAAAAAAHHADEE